MKRLIIGAAVAAMCTGAFADANVYEIQLKAKTTKASVVNTKGDTTVYRVQGTKSFKGLVWGCGCEAVYGRWELTDTDAVSGCVIWDEATKMPVYVGRDADVTAPESAAGCELGWAFVNRIGKKGTDVEGVFTLAGTGDECGITDTINLVCAGFGTSKDCEKVDKMSGNFAGYLAAPSASSSTCRYCSGDGACELSLVWNLCDCCDAGTSDWSEKTAAGGTWSLKYNSKLSKKLSAAKSILDVYDFKKLPLVADAVRRAEAAVKGE